MATEFKPLEPPYLPLVGESAQAFFEELIQPDWKIFEWGLGSSSLWFAQRASEVVSVENVPEWAEYIATLKPSNLTIQSVPGRKNTPHWRSMLALYVAIINGYSDGYFDLVFSDGWAESRTPCPARAMPKVKPGGWLVVDDVTWNPAKLGAEPLIEAGWAQTRKPGIVPVERTWDEHGRKNTTAFFQRPEQQ